MALPPTSFEARWAPSYVAGDTMTSSARMLHREWTRHRAATGQLFARSDFARGQGGHQHLSRVTPFCTVTPLPQHFNARVTGPLSSLYQ